MDKEVDVLKPKLEALKATVNEITTELYKNANPPPGADQQAGAEQQAGEQTEGQAEQQTTEQSSESSNETKTN